MSRALPWSPRVVDFALILPEADPERLVLLDMSLGGYLASRAAAFEHRLAACILYDGVPDVHEPIAGPGSRAASVPGGLEALIAPNTTARWLVHTGLWSFCVPGSDELLKAAEAYTMAGIADRITCPTLVLEAEHDRFFQGATAALFGELTGENELIAFREDEGAGEHCQEGALFLSHQRTFDWLDTVLAS